MIPWIGGKYYYAKWIIEHFPANYKEMVYVEPFGGAGWVLFKKEPSKLEVYNDINSDLVHLFRTLRDNFEEFERRAYWVLHSREMWKEAHEKVFKTREFKDDVDRALQFAICIIQSHSGFGHSWRHSITYKLNRAWEAFYKRLQKIRERLMNVQIENLDYREIFKKYDSENTLFYLDPPYMISNKTNDYYNVVKWTYEDHEELMKHIKKLKGYWLLSYYPNDTLKEWYGEYNWYYKDGKKYSQNKRGEGAKSKCVEALITNIPEEIMVKNCKGVYPTSSLKKWLDK